MHMSGYNLLIRKLPLLPTELFLKSESMYEDVTAGFLPTLEMPIERGIVNTALGTRSKRIKKQVLPQFVLETGTF